MGPSRLLAVLLVVGLAGCLPSGQKLLSLEVQREDEVVLSTTFDAVDTSTEAEIWDSAGEVPFSTQVDAIEPSAADPLMAELEGTVQIRIMWTGAVESAVTLDGLLLVRSAPDSSDWRLPFAETRRAKAAAGL